MPDDHDALVRIEERLKMLTDLMPTLVTKNEFLPVKTITYGFSGAVLIAFVSGIISLIIKK